MARRGWFGFREARCDVCFCVVYPIDDAVVGHEFHAVHLLFPVDTSRFCTKHNFFLYFLRTHEKKENDFQF